jgi:hypothetical protein
LDDTELAAQFKESALLEKWIRENLEGLGLGFDNATIV